MDDIFDLLESETARVINQTPEDEFIAWITRGPMSKFDQMSVYIRHEMMIFDFIMVDEEFSVSKTIPGVSGPITKKLDRKGIAKLILKYHVLSYSMDVWQNGQGKGKTLNIDLVLDRLINSDLGRLLYMSPTSRRPNNPITT